MDKRGYVYIMTNYEQTSLYIGVTSNLIKRVYEHKNNLVKSFTSKYRIHNLVYYEVFDEIELAITREKYLKGKKRQFKTELINSKNPNWNDLYNEII